jgi:hypothetical protein
MTAKRTGLVLAIGVAALAATAIWLPAALDGMSAPDAGIAPINPEIELWPQDDMNSDGHDLPKDETGNAATHSTKPSVIVPDRPFGEAYPDLVAAAAEGDRTATILLAKGLAACADRADLRRSYGNRRSRAERLTKIATSVHATDKDREAMDRAILVMDDAKARLDAKEEACNGVPESAITGRWRQQLAAAHTGDADMIVDFVTHPAMDPREAFGDDSSIRAYRENAPRLLEQLIRDNDLRGYQAYVRAGYDALMRKEEFRFHDALSRVLKPDPVRVLAYDIALGQSGFPGVFGSGSDYEALSTRQLDPAQRLAAEAMARQIAPQVAASASAWLQAHPPRPAGG